MNDLISRQAAMAFPLSWEHRDKEHGSDEFISGVECYRDYIENLPSAQPTLYGYRIEHLAYIARVMEKEGVTAEYAVRTFDDVGRMVKMILEEAHEVVYENMYSRFIRFEPYEGEEE